MQRLINGFMVGCAALAGSLPAVGDTVVFEPQYLYAEELRPVIESLLSGNGSVHVVDSRLVVSGSEDALGSVEHVVSLLDIPRARLLIHITNTDPMQATSAQSSGAVLRTHTRPHNMGSVSVSVLEGLPVVVRSSDSILAVRWAAVWDEGLAIESNERVAKNELYARALVNDDEVTVELSSHREDFVGAHSSDQQSSSINTRLQGKVGRWYPVIESNRPLSTTPFTHVHSTRPRIPISSQPLWIKVEYAPAP